jgi:cytochrome bd-type quinol oxidase subunit 2
MHLATIWYLVVAVFWVGFLVLEGFDFGVGMLQAFLGRSDVERRLAVNTIGPFWDGNEVWLIVGGAAIFAAFPGWYATMFSSLYLALVLVLAALMVRGVSFEYGRKIDDERWRTAWTWGLAVSSALVPLLVGTALGDLLHGLPIDAAHNYTGTFVGLLVPYGLFTGVMLTVACLFLGSTFLALKTSGDLRERAISLAPKLGWITVVLVWGWVTWSHIGMGKGFVPNILDPVAVMAAVGGAWFAAEKAEGWAFVSACLTIGAAVGSLFVDLFPRVMVSTTSSAYSLTVANTASPNYTLTVMTVVAVVFFPVVLLYQGWSFRVFRARLKAPPVSDAAAGAPSAPPPTSASPPTTAS